MRRKKTSWLYFMRIFVWILTSFFLMALVASRIKIDLKYFSLGIKKILQTFGKESVSVICEEKTASNIDFIKSNLSWTGPSRWHAENLPQRTYFSYNLKIHKGPRIFGPFRTHHQIFVSENTHYVSRKPKWKIIVHDSWHRLHHL